MTISSSSLMPNVARFKDTSDRYRYCSAKSNELAGMLCGSFHDAVFGEVVSFLAKYGDRAASMNLWRWNVSSYASIVISVVLGVSRVRSEVMCAARGWSGFVDFA